MILSHIVAAAANGVIGVNNDLPWRIPEDLKFFREKTRGKAIIMGRKTFASLGKPLPHRLNMVVTRRGLDAPRPDVNTFTSVDEAITHARLQTSLYGEEIFIIGGGEIFAATLPLVDVVYLTRIHRAFGGDVKYPELPAAEFDLVERRDRLEPIPFSFLTYHRRRPAHR